MPDGKTEGKTEAKPGANGKRLFIGVRISVPTANALVQCVESLGRRSREAGVDIKWVSPASYHVTLKFLGWTREDTIGAVRDAVGVAVTGVAGFRFRTSRLGGFPSLDKANVIWAGVEDPAALTELAGRIERACVGLGFPAEKRPFHPHVTLGRLKETRAIRDVVLPLSEQMFSDSRIDGVILYESETKSSGSVHREISRISFKQAEIREERQTGAVELVDETDDGWPRGHGQ